MVKQKPTRRLEPGDLICGKCGEGNPPIRKFCSRCGDQLAGAHVVTTRWYRRLMLWRRKPKSLEVGTRPGEKGSSRSSGHRVKKTIRRLRDVFAIITFAALFAYALVPPLRGPINSYIAHPFQFAKGEVMERWHAMTNPYVDVPVVETLGTAPTRSTSTDDAVDGNTNSFWATKWDSKRHPYLSVVFAEPKTIAALVIHNGAPEEDASKFLQPKSIVVKYRNGLTEELQLEFSGEPQTFELDQAQLVRRIRFEVTAVHAKDEVTNLAIREIEFKSRK